MINIEAHVYLRENLLNRIADRTAIVGNDNLRVSPAELVAAMFDALEHLDNLRI